MNGTRGKAAGKMLELEAILEPEDIVAALSDFDQREWGYVFDELLVNPEEEAEADFVTGYTTEKGRRNIIALYKSVKRWAEENPEEAEAEELENFI